MCAFHAPKLRERTGTRRVESSETEDQNGIQITLTHGKKSPSAAASTAGAIHARALRAVVIAMSIVVGALATAATSATASTTAASTALRRSIATIAFKMTGLPKGRARQSPYRLPHSCRQRPTPADSVESADAPPSLCVRVHSHVAHSSV